MITVSSMCVLSTDSNFENNTANGPGGALYYDQSEGTVSPNFSSKVFPLLCKIIET